MPAAVIPIFSVKSPWKLKGEGREVEKSVPKDVMCRSPPVIQLFARQGMVTQRGGGRGGQKKGKKVGKKERKGGKERGKHYLY